MDQKERLLVGLFDLFKNDVLVDLSIECGDKVINCHRNVLAASSPFFRAMLTNEVTEAKNGQVTISDTPPEILEQVVAYCYHGDIRIDNDNVQDILTTANMFEMLQLRDLCAEYMIKELHQSNCVQMFQLADVLSCPMMKDKAWKFLLENFVSVCQTDQMLGLSYEDIHRILSSDDLYIDCEELVFEAVVNWVKGDLEERKSRFGELFSCVRLGLLSIEYLTNVIWNEALIHENPLLRGQVAMAKLSCISQGTDSEDTMGREINSHKRLGMFNIPMIVFSGGGMDHNSRSLTGFDPLTSSNYFAIKPHANFDNRFRVDLHQLVTAPGNKIFTLGGIYYVDHHFEDEARALDEVRLFDHRRKLWLSKPSMPEPRCAFGAVCVGNDVYVTGGKSIYPSGDILDTVARFNTCYEKWSVCPSMPFKLFHHRVVAVQDCFYVVGGYIEDTMATDTILHFDVASQVWTVMDAHMKIPRAEFGVAFYNGKIWVLGGSDGTQSLSSTETFVIESNRWRYGPDFLEDRKASTLLVLNDELYAYGGIRTIQIPSRASRVLESRDLSRLDENNQWQRVVRNVQYGNMNGCTVGQLNVKWLTESDYHSNENVGSA